MKRWLCILLLTGCGSGSASAPTGPVSSSTIALTADDRELWVVSPDADSVSVIDPQTRALQAEVALGTAPPAVDPVTRRYDPAVKPRALSIDGDFVYVAGQTANRLFVIDRAQRSVVASVPVPVDPTGVVASPQAIYVVSHEAATVTKIDPKTRQVVATLPVTEHPWGASLSGDGHTLYVTHLLQQAGVTEIDTGSFTIRATNELPKQPRASDKLVPNGTPRGVYMAVPQPVTGEVWLPHLLLAVDTAQPALDFQSTVFPTLSTSKGRLFTFKPMGVPGAQGSFSDVVSGPRAIAFTPDGTLALVANSGSEDVLVLDGQTGAERGLVRPLPATFLEGVVVDHAGQFAYVDGRNSHNVVVLRLQPGDPVAPVLVDGDPIDRLHADPMPPRLRLGQRIFYTSNSSQLPITQNFWVSCSSCHLEGGTDAVTWRFTVGPRDTPSNAGGPINTGFLLRQALRNSLLDYDNTINIEQGGRFHRTDAMQADLLQALADFTNFAIPLPQNPWRSADGSLTEAQARGQTLFAERCASCHTGDWLTDSGAGNPTLDLAGPIMLHDVGTCVTGGDFPDQPAPDDVVGNLRGACAFDTPTLRGVFASPPYLHDGSAATLRDVIDRLPFSATLGEQEKSDLVAYVQTL